MHLTKRLARQAGSSSSSSCSQKSNSQFNHKCNDLLFGPSLIFLTFPRGPYISESLLHMNNSTIKRRKKSAACPGPHVCQTIDRSMHLLLKLIFLHSIQFGLSLSLLAAQQQTASQRFSSRLHFDPFLTTSTLNFLGLNWKICIENGPLRQCPPKY